MASWLWLAVCAQFLYAISTLVDKHIVVRAQHIGRPIVYAFYVSLLSGFVLILVPFGVVRIPDLAFLALALCNACTFVLAIYFLYRALSVARASDVAPVVGAISAIAAALLAFLGIAGERNVHLVLPILLLAGGTAVISHFHFSRRAILATFAAGFFFGITAFSMKLVFLETSFLDGYFWTRMMNVLVALGFLCIPSVRQVILHGTKQSTRGAKQLILGNKVLGGVAAALTGFAISLGPVSVVNALGGLQFVFLFAFSFIFARQMPLYDDRKTGSHGGWHTAAGVTLIVLGLAGLYLI